MQDSCKAFEDNPLSFWRLLTDKGSGVGELALIAVILFEICPHAAHIERLWCVMDGIHTKSRNRLALSKVTGAASIQLETATSRGREASN